MAVDRISLLALFLVLCCASVSAQSCESQTLCRDCIGTAGCVWCADSGFTGTRCQRSSSISGCNSLQNPNGSIDSIDTSSASNPVSIRNISLTLRVGEPQTFRIQVTPLRDLPLDLYILMDLSNSMSDELQSVKDISGQIAQRIRNVTTNVRLGFGSFNDKVTRPFTRNTCGTDFSVDNCNLYAFRHQIDLTSDAMEFTNAIQAVNTTTNVDNPENGLEGLAQVVTCEDIIGWRSRSATGDQRGLTRVVLFLTDDQFHYSGEGRLAGILRPYDGQCYLERGALPIQYNRWDEFDYPSVGQIVSLLTQFEVVTIFAVAQERLPTYRNLRDLVNQKYRASVATLTNRSTDILNLIDSEYRAILQVVSLTPPTIPDLTFSIQATCPPGATLLSDNSCDDVQLESAVDFNITVTLNSCADEIRNGATRVVRVNVPSFGEFNITYTGACNCDCERNPGPVVNSPLCSGNGSFVCGVCDCNPGFCGPNCSIVLGNRAAQDCPFNCSDRGLCDCTCMCNTPDPATEPELSEIRAMNPVYEATVFNGMDRACECDNFRCRLAANGLSCSGNGECCNKRCRCNVFPGTDETYHAPGTPSIPGNCECPPESFACCRNQTANMVCNGNGRCNCTSCSCSPGFVGQCCDRLDSRLCNLPVDMRCVLCEKEVQTQNCNDRDCRRVELIDPMLVPMDSVTRIVEIVNMRINDGTRYNITSPGECTARDANSCTHGYFLLSNDQSNTVIAVVNDPPVCPVTEQFQLAIPIWAIALIILGGLLLLGILILVLIKIIFLILDYMEVKRWEKEAKEADFSKNQNPLYQSPEMKYENVAYGRE